MEKQKQNDDRQKKNNEREEDSNKVPRAIFFKYRHRSSSYPLNHKCHLPHVRGKIRFGDNRTQ